MVHKKYIKRGDRIFGPYLYENYRVNGITKTRYLGIGKSNKNKKLFFILGIVIAFILILSFATVLLGKSFEDEIRSGELAAESPLNFLRNLFTATSPLNVLVEIISLTPPIIENIPEEIYVCENKALAHDFYVIDEDGVKDVSVDISDKDPFYLSYYIFDKFTINAQIWSFGALTKFHFIGHRNAGEGWATYPETITATDGIRTDSADTNIVIIEVNNEPGFDIGVQTIDLYTIGDESVFYYDLGGILENNLEETPKDQLIYNLTYQDGSKSPFNISDLGIINITGNESFIREGGNSTTYHLSLSVYDTGLSTILHPEIVNVCYPYNLNEDPKEYSQDFSLTITKENRAPNIISYYPLNLDLDVSGTENLYFNVSARDPDLTPLDIYWYVDGIEKLKEKATNFSEFNYNFGCGASGEHKIKALATDGLLNDSVEWNFSVSFVKCSEPPLGGGGGGVVYCEEKWACKDWGQCKNLEQIYQVGWMQDSYNLIKERCELFNFSEESCGFQSRVCIDANFCKTTYNKPGIIRECYYTENPTCDDEIKNCHHGYCEVMVDCGGPCDPCPTCSDGIKNQGEERIDCGSPCRPCVEFAWIPAFFKSVVSYSIIALFILIIFLVFKQIKKYKIFKKVAGQTKKPLQTVQKIPKQTGNISTFIFILMVIILLFGANIYIMGVAKTGRILPGPEDIGFLASYGLLNSLIRNIPLFFVGGPVTSWDNNAELTTGDDSDTVNRYNGQDFYFYAEYNYVGSGLPVSSGSCRIHFDSDSGYSSWYDMNYDEISRFEYTFINGFNYKGQYDFEVECSEDGTFNEGISLGFVRVTEPFVITNTPPEFIEGTEQETYSGFEDIVLIHNFSMNITEPDINDELVFSILSINDVDKSNYPWIELNDSTGILMINSTIDFETGLFKIAVDIVDTNDEGESREFYFHISLVNDPPVFDTLENKTLSAGDLFEYKIDIQDEEGDIPFLFDVDFLDTCVTTGNPSCILFDDITGYDFNENTGELNLHFTPTVDDIGVYFINFSVMDNSSLGNQTTSQIVNFTVNIALWKSPLNLDYNLIEDQEPSFYLNLSENVTGDITFSNGTAFSSFNLNSEGIIDFTPIDEDVGYWQVEIIADDGTITSSKIFNFSITNINDSVSIYDINVDGHISMDANYNIEAYENSNIVIFLFANDDDLLIPQKDFYNEVLHPNLIIEGPNESLFDFVYDTTDKNSSKFDASFIPREFDVGEYNITINVSDANNFSSDFLEFDLIILNQDYDTPNITFPDSFVEFNLKENRTSADLVFRANHTVGDNLTYEFYINNELRKSINYFGDDTDLVWDFVPSFTDETYDNEIKNLTLFVLNNYLNIFNTSRTWNLTINHTNAPVEFILDIGDKKGISLDYSLKVDLKTHFLDADYYDDYYNQSVEFDIKSNGSIMQASDVSEDWIFFFSSSAPAIEVFNITAYDLNETGGNMTNIASNNFIVEFVEAKEKTVYVPVPTSGSTQKVPISLKILLPGEISAYEGKKMDISLTLINSGKTGFNGLSLNSSAWKQGEVIEEIETSLDKDYLASLKAGQEENLTLSVFFNTDVLGEYEILVEVVSKSPSYKDWGKIHVKLEAINESEVRNLIVFTEEFIAERPECIEIKELVDEARDYTAVGDYENARLKTEQAINSCKDAISQISTPKLRFKSLEIDVYFIIAIAFALIIGLAYYFLKRRQLQKVTKVAQKTEGIIRQGMEKNI